MHRSVELVGHPSLNDNLDFRSDNLECAASGRSS